MYGNIILIIFLVYQIIYLFDLLKNNKRKIIKEKNEELNKYRNIAIKTLNEQKEFLNVRYPKNKFKFTKELIPNLMIRIGCIIILFQFFNLEMKMMNINVNIFISVLIVIITSIILNYILGKFNLQKNDISVFFK